jgi:hypothetical protein
MEFAGTSQILIRYTYEDYAIPGATPTVSFPTAVFDIKRDGSKLVAFNRPPQSDSAGFLEWNIANSEIVFVIRSTVPPSPFIFQR